MSELVQLSAAERLRNSKDVVLSRWEEQARKILPAAKKQETPVLLDMLPHFIDEIAEALEHSGKDACASGFVCREHGQQRAYAEGYTFDQVADEYRLLRTVILEVLEVDGTLSGHDRDCILESIFNGIRDAGSEYMRRLLEREQRVVEELRRERDLRAEFIATLSHDLRNPLSAARASTQLIMRYGDKLEVRQKATARLLASLARADEMLADFLDFQRIQAGHKLHLKMASTNLNLLLEDLISELKTIHGDRFAMRLPESISGNWNAKHLRRAIENLVNNALKYGDKDSAITMSVVTRDGEIVISVNNKGNPIPPEEQEKIFEPFYRSGNQQMVSQKKGWGLGLLLVKGIAAAHGGKIELQSSAREGTTFSIIIPKNAGRQ